MVPHKPFVVSAWRFGSVCLYTVEPREPEVDTGTGCVVIEGGGSSASPKPESMDTITD